MANEQGGFKFPEEEQAARQFEAGDGGHTETELSASVKEAVDLAWRAEGLEKVMQQKGDNESFY